MRKHMLVLLSLVAGTGAMAQQLAGSCSTVAAEKKLVGSAKAAFIKKCEMDLKAMSTMATKQQKPMVSSKDESSGHCGHDAASL